MVNERRCQGSNKVLSSPKTLLKAIKMKVVKPKLNVIIRTSKFVKKISNSLPGSAYGYMIGAIAYAMQGVADPDLSSTFYTLATTTSDVDIPLVGAYIYNNALWFIWADLSTAEYTPTALLIGLPVNYTLSNGNNASGYIYPFATIPFYNYTKTSNDYLEIEWYIYMNMSNIQPYQNMFLPNNVINGIVSYTNQTSGVNYGAIQITYGGNQIEIQGNLSASESCGTDSVNANVQLQSDIVGDIASGTVTLSCKACTSSSQTTTTCSGSYVVTITFTF